MRGSVLPVFGRRALVTLGVAVTLAAGSTGNSSLSARQGGAPPDPLKFNLDSPVFIIASIKPAKVADFQAGWAILKSEFESSSRPEVKEFGATITRIFKVDPALIGQAAGADAPVNFVFQIDSPSKTQSYSPTAIIYNLLHKMGAEGGIPRAKADEIWGKLEPAYKDGQISIWPLSKVG
jgi:hypothetical protein